MPSTYSDLLRLEKQANGENDTTWGTKMNTVLEMIEDAIAGRAAVSMTDANYTLTTASSATDEARMAILNIASSVPLTANRNVVVPTTAKKYTIKNATTGGFSIVVKTAAGTGITIPSGRTMPVFCDGTNVVVDQDWAQLVEIVDTSLNELIKFTTTASAVNEITIANAATGVGPSIAATGETNVDITLKGKGTGSVILGQATTTGVQLAADQPVNDSSNNEYIKFSKTASAVNEVTITNAATGKMPQIAASGGDSNPSLILTGKGTGGVIAPVLGFAGTLIGGKITLAVGASALTVAVKTFAGNDPSAAEPVYILMPTVTSNLLDAGFAVRTITAALSVVVSSGSTLGHASTIASPVYVYAMDNAGTIELAVSNRFFGGASVQSSTAEGGAGASDSATVLYSTTARSNVAVVCLQRWKSTQTTAGTWAATTGERQLFPFPYKKPSVQVFTATGANTYTKPWDMLSAKAKVWGAGGGAGGTVSSGGWTGGGAGGGYSERTRDASDIGPTETATVGAGGGGGNSTGTNGSNGGTSSFGAHCSATGGSASNGSTGGAGVVGGPSPGSGSSGDVNETGSAGMNGASNSFGGTGGPGANGGGGGIGNFDSAGGNGGLPGGGGGGVRVSASSSSGGSGANGVVAVEESYS